MFTKRDAKKLKDKVQVPGSELCDQLSGSSCQWVKSNPWAGAGIGIALGFVVGVLISKK